VKGLPNPSVIYTVNKNNLAQEKYKMSVIFTGNVRDAVRKMVSSGAFVLEEGVPIFGSHSRELPGGKKVVVTDEDLPDICHNTHELFNGYFPCVTIGHRNHNPNAKEIDQPPVVGFIVGLEPRDGVIFADLLIYRHKLSDYISYPYRSAEYVAESKTIVGLAVLTRPPFLGIGTKIESIEYSPGKYPNLSRNRVQDADLVFKRV
jgi:hypothetical protein